LEEKKQIHSAVKSLQRTADDAKKVSASMDTTSAKSHMRQLTKPSSPTSTMKKVGIALIAAPDPITGAIGVPLVAAAYALKSKQPASLDTLAKETRRLIQDLKSISL